MANAEREKLGCKAEFDFAIKALEDVELTVDAQITFDEYVRRCNITQSDDCPYDE